MNAVKVAAFLLLLASTAFGQATSFSIEGVWVLNKARTAAALEESNTVLPAQFLNNLQGSYDSLAYVFKGNRTTYTPKETIDDQPVWYSWKPESLSDDEVVINIDGLEEAVRFEIARDRTCIGHEITDLNYTEWYCRQP